MALISLGVTVVIPVYNRAALVVEAMESVLAQKWPAVEIVVVDDGSTDATPDAVATYVEKADHRIRLIRQPNQGGSAARNAGIAAARYPFVAFLDSDDRWLPGKLAAQMHIFESDPSVDVAFTAYIERWPTTSSTVVLPHWVPAGALEKLLEGSCVNTSSVVVRTETLEKVGAFDVGLSHCEDHDLWLRLASAGANFAYLPEPLTETRRQHDSLAAQSAEVARASELVIARLFASGALPPEIQRARRRHAARWCLNSAGRHLQAGDGRSALGSLGRAVAWYPPAVRPGWCLMAAAALRLEWPLRPRR
jgi:glycosyltransferase involved in cell wall biosynthesis